MNEKIQSLKFISTIILTLYGFFLTAQEQIYTIPVVVHVVWRDSQENISDEQIAGQMTVLNLDFNKLNCEIPLIEPEFRDRAADIGFAFCLATIDPAGQPTSGITRTTTTIDDIGKAIHISTNRRRIYYTDLGGADAWNPQEYLNIWVCDMGDVGESGFGSRPGINIEAEDGVLCDFRNFGYTTTPGHETGRTMTHEIGHYFDLLHIWGTTSDCSDDDGVEDTPLQTGPHFGCMEEIGLCPGTTSAMTMNFMDYTDDKCMAMFSEGQKTRMRTALTGPRQGLTLSEKCQITIDPDDARFRLFPSPADEKIILQLQNPDLIICNIVVFDISGRRCLSEETMSGEVEIDCRTYPAGLYIVKATVSNGVRLLAKFAVR